MGENTLLADGRRARLVCVLSTPHRAWVKQGVVNYLKGECS